MQWNEMKLSLRKILRLWAGGILAKNPTQFKRFHAMNVSFSMFTVVYIHNETQDKSRNIFNSTQTAARKVESFSLKQK